MLPVVATRGVLATSSLVLLGIFFGFNASGRAEPPSVDQLREQASRVLVPIAGQLRAAGLRQPVDVRRDQWGVAHIEAQNQQDLFFAQGLVAAQDRLFQMELWRRVGAGEMAELFGPEALEGDRFARLIRYRGDMEAEWKSYSPDTLEIATAFTAGINAWIEQCGDDRLPIEFQLLKFKPRRWRPEDILTRMSGIVMSGNWQRELSRARLIAAVGVEKARQLAPTDPLRDFDFAAPLPSDWFQGDIARGYTVAARNPLFKAPVSESNNWVVDGRLSQSGHPLLAGDPHRAIALPSLRYIVHLKAPGWNVIGAGEPALPGVAIGHNEHVAWAFTIIGTDQADLFVEQMSADKPGMYRVGDRWEPFTRTQETISVRGRPSPETVELRFTRHGPVIFHDDKRGIAIALKWSGAEPGGAAYLPSLAVDRARNAEELVQSLARWKIPCLNFVFADVHGKIGWVAAAATPRRPRADGLLPVPGWTGEHDWQGFLSLEQLPQIHQPAEGWIATANHNILPPGYPHAIAYDWESPFRYDRIRERLSTVKPESAKKHTLADFQSIQHEHTSLAARGLVAALRLATIPADLAGPAALLTQWNAEMSRESAAAAFYAVWLQELEKAFFAARLPTDPQLERGAIRKLPILIRELAQPTTAWFGDSPVAARDQLVAETLRRAVDRTKKALGDDQSKWRWGALHTVTFRHPLAGMGPSFETAFNVGPFSRGGDVTTPNNTRHDETFQQVHGASYRQVFDLADWDRGMATNTPGQSGQLGSVHYGDLASLWADERYFPLVFSDARVAAETAHHLRLTP
jgi:penicillin amidase